MPRSTFLLDEGYTWRINNPERGPDFTTDSAGDLGLRLAVNGGDATAIGSFSRPISIAESYRDLVRYAYEAADIEINATFFVYSSRSAIWDLELTNRGERPAALTLAPFVALPAASVRRLQQVGFSGDVDMQAIAFEHAEPPDGWMRNHDIPHVAEVRDLFAVLNETGEVRWSSPEMASSDSIFLAGNANLSPGASTTIKVLRLVEPARDSDSADALLARADSLARMDITPYLTRQREWMQGLDLDRFQSREDRLLYLAAANLMTQVFYPPEGRSSYPYYVFSREPTWGWGHGGQVFHESLTMLALAQLDPRLAFASQYAYEERQHDNGYINYRTGSYLDEVIVYRDTLTSSAPWYAYINAELYRITEGSGISREERDEFLRRMYASSRRFYEYYTASRDRDGDGIAEWGGHAVLESVRDSEVAIWDEVGWPTHFEGIDVNAMLVMEEKSLAYMADQLGLKEETGAWRDAAARRAALVNRYMWDEETGFYYHVDRRDNDFTFEKPDDLKRREIIGFLPLWAGIADSSQAARLIEHLTDPNAFWRPNGVPTLAADDPYYNPRGYWNGPVWIQWNYLIWRGLHDYAYHNLADELRNRNKAIMLDRLRAEHNLFELYDPDSTWAGYHQPYIWAGIINAMME